MPGKISVTIITLNEADHIAAAIDSVRWADEVIVIDANSTDRTAEIALEKGARVEKRPWPGYAAQKNYAASLASNDWILSLDADERVTPELAREITATTGSSAAHGYRIPRLSHYLGRWIRTTDFYPDYQTRLYDRRHARWEERLVHESVKVDGVRGQLRNDLQHYSFRDVADHVERINRYSTLSARQMFESGKRSSGWQMLVHPPAAFLRNFILRRGFMDGAVGLTISLLNSYGVFLKFAKLRELQQQR